MADAKAKTYYCEKHPELQISMGDGVDKDTISGAAMVHRGTMLKFENGVLILHKPSQIKFMDKYVATHRADRIITSEGDDEEIMKATEAILSARKGVVTGARSSGAASH